MTPSSPHTGHRGDVVVDATDVAAIVDLAYAASRLRRDPERQVAHLLGGFARLLCADGAAVYAVPARRATGGSGLAAVRGYRWTGEDTAQLNAALHGHDLPGGAWVDWADRVAGCERLCVIGPRGRVFYLCSKPPPGDRRRGRVTIAFKRPGEVGAFAAADAAVLRAFHRTSLAELLTRRRPPVAAEDAAGLAPRARATLAHLLVGLTEKQVAERLQVSRHTVHVYVKRIYRHYSVNSRGELMARWIGNAGPSGTSPGRPEREEGTSL
jgi:DNA-binding CsgD family transcriptional regulator